jgi:hypothetical protein
LSAQGCGFVDDALRAPPDLPWTTLRVAHRAWLAPQAPQPATTICNSRLKDTRFMQQQAHDLGRTTPNNTQQHKHQAKQADHKRSAIGVSLRATWTELSQILRQLWRFLKNCFACRYEPSLYTRQLAPILERYLRKSPDTVTHRVSTQHRPNAAPALGCSLI